MRWPPLGMAPWSPQGAPPPYPTMVLADHREGPRARGEPDLGCTMTVTALAGKEGTDGDAKLVSSGLVRSQPMSCRHPRSRGGSMQGPTSILRELVPFAI